MRSITRVLIFFSRDAAIQDLKNEVKRLNDIKDAKDELIKSLERKILLDELQKKVEQRKKEVQSDSNQAH
ncbi:hypothetical protein KW791_01825 [Candidatus Parcubacteria bacterium]|nr:hypothetical protein [Candidatus Parcubacteria bacterium]